MHIGTSYGLQAAAAVDKYAAMFEELLDSVDILLTGPTKIIEFIPLLARAPTWLPGIGGLLRRIAYYRDLTTEAREAPWADAKDALVGLIHRSPPSVMAQWSRQCFYFRHLGQPRKA